MAEGGGIGPQCPSRHSRFYRIASIARMDARRLGVIGLHEGRPNSDRCSVREAYRGLRNLQAYTKTHLGMARVKQAGPPTFSNTPISGETETDSLILLQQKPENHKQFYSSAWISASYPSAVTGKIVSSEDQKNRMFCDCGKAHHAWKRSPGFVSEACRHSGCRDISRRALSSGCTPRTEGLSIR